jgi:hypothetical protein
MRTVVTEIVFSRGESGNVKSFGLGRTFWQGFVSSFRERFLITYEKLGLYCIWGCGPNVILLYEQRTPSPPTMPAKTSKVLLQSSLRMLPTQCYPISNIHHPSFLNFCAPGARLSSFMDVKETCTHCSCSISRVLGMLTRIKDFMEILKLQVCGHEAFNALV